MRRQGKGHTPAAPTAYAARDALGHLSEGGCADNLILPRADNQGRVLDAGEFVVDIMLQDGLLSARGCFRRAVGLTFYVPSFQPMAWRRIWTKSR